MDTWTCGSEMRRLDVAGTGLVFSRRSYEAKEYGPSGGRIPRFDSVYDYVSQSWNDYSPAMNTLRITP
jgi:hypothetical protein